MIILFFLQYTNDRVSVDLCVVITANISSLKLIEEAELYIWHSNFSIACGDN